MKIKQLIEKYEEKIEENNALVEINPFAAVGKALVLRENKIYKQFITDLKNIKDD